MKRVKACLSDAEVVELVDYMADDAEEAVLFERDSKCSKILSDIYTVVHSHRKEHSCHSVHIPWRKNAVEMLDKFRRDRRPKRGRKKR